MISIVEPIDVACQQVLAEDRSVSSLQWMTVPASWSSFLSPEFLLEKYLKYIRRSTLSMVRPEIGEDSARFRLAATSIGIITFSHPRVLTVGRARTISLAINGGLLVQRDQCHRGQMSITCEPSGDGWRITLCLADFCPLLLGDKRSRLRKWLYRFTQAYIHKRVTTRFLARVYREIAGKNACIRFVTVRPERGESI